MWNISHITDSKYDLPGQSKSLIDQFPSAYIFLSIHMYSVVTLKLMKWFVPKLYTQPNYRSRKKRYGIQKKGISNQHLNTALEIYRQSIFDQNSGFLPILKKQNVNLNIIWIFFFKIWIFTKLWPWTEKKLLEGDIYRFLCQWFFDQNFVF